MSRVQLADRVASLRGVFLNELAGNRFELTKLLLIVDENLSPAERRRLTELTHSLAGRGGTFGFPGLSDAAAEVHDLLDTSMRCRREAARKLTIAIAQVLDPPPRIG